MDPNANAVMNKISSLELANLQLQDIKQLASFMNVPVLNKRKDSIIDDISKRLCYMVSKPTAPMPNDSHLINYDLNYLLTNPHLNKIIQNFHETVPNQNLNQGINLISKKSEQESPSLTGLSNSLPQLTHTLSGNSINSNLSPCLCGEFLKSEVKGLIISCINHHCQRKFHVNCVKFNQKSDDVKIFECFVCVLKACDPLHEVLQTLSPPAVLNNKKIDFLLDKETFALIKGNENIGVEIRCIRLEEKSIEPTWPHQGELQLNGRRELEFRPLAANSALKKRKDEKLFSRNILSGLNNVVIRFSLRQDQPKGKGPQTETYVAGVYLVKKLQPKELITKVMQNNLRSIENCKKRIMDQFANEAIQIDKLSYTLFCVLDMQPLKTPAKGLHCKHVNCFSLENYINVWYKNNQRKWQCPICKLKAYDIVIDTYFQEILKAAEKLGVMNSESPDVTFNNKGEYTFTGKEKEVMKMNEKKVKPSETMDLEDLEEETKTKVETKNPSHKKVEEAPMIVLDDSDEEMCDEKAESAKEINNGPKEISNGPKEINNLLSANQKGEAKTNENNGSNQSKLIQSEQISKLSPTLNKMIDLPKLQLNMAQMLPSELLKLSQSLNPSATKPTFEPVILTKPVRVLTPIEKPQAPIESKNDDAMDIVDESPKSAKDGNNDEIAVSDSSSVIMIEPVSQKPQTNVVQPTFIPEIPQHYGNTDDKENCSLSQLSIEAIENSDISQYQAEFNDFERVESGSVPLPIGTRSILNETKKINFEIAKEVKLTNGGALSKSNSLRNEPMVIEETKSEHSQTRSANDPIASKKKLAMLFEKHIEKKSAKDKGEIDQGILRKTISKKSPERPSNRFDKGEKPGAMLPSSEKGKVNMTSNNPKAAMSTTASSKTLPEKTTTTAVSAPDKNLKLQGNFANPICLDDDDD